MEFSKKLFDAAKSAGYKNWEIYSGGGRSFSVRIFKGEVDEYKNSESSGFCFRGAKDERLGYAFSESFDPAVIPDVLKNAAENASLIEEEDMEELYAGDSSYESAECYNEALENYSPSKKIELALALEKAAFAADSRVVAVDYCYLGTGSGSEELLNSFGLELKKRENIAYSYLVARAEENGVNKTGFAVWIGDDLANFCYETLAKQAVARAVGYFGAKAIPSGVYPVVFENLRALELLQAFSSAFSAERAQKGFSLLNGKEEQQIAAPCVNLIDEGISARKTFLAAPFDSEGVRTQSKKIIDKGILTTLLYNCKSAKKAGKKSTGNGFKPSFRSPVDTSPTNFYIEPGTEDLSALFEKIHNGVYITELQGLHSGLNPISGDFSVGADGFLIENGKIARPIEQITVSGNFFAMLKNITALSNRLVFDPPSSGTYGAPDILAGELTISGL